MTPEALLDFWFSAALRPHWFRATPELDARIDRLYRQHWESAKDGGLAHWEKTPRGALALVILLDQLPLNMFRGQARGFATEAAARAVAERAIAGGFDSSLRAEEKMFLYMPYMHSEAMEDQERSVTLFSAAGLQDNLRWAEHHREIIRRFGRFPHRNAILGRTSTPEEVAWLHSPEAFQG